MENVLYFVVGILFIVSVIGLYVGFFYYHRKLNKILESMQVQITDLENIIVAKSDNMCEVLQRGNHR